MIGKIAFVAGCLVSSLAIEQPNNQPIGFNDTIGSTTKAYYASTRKPTRYVFV